MSDVPELLTAESLDVTVPGRALVRGLDLDLRAGEFLTILGKNGAGKTLTLHTLAGLRPPAAGHIILKDLELRRWKKRALAQTIALLPQDSEDVFPSRVLETVLIGRHPHIGALQVESATDRSIAQAALREVGIEQLSDRDVGSLSGGERRRLAIAQLLCQQPQIYLLDEPVNHLDPQHQLQVLKLFRKLADEGASVVATLHDVNLAARFCDRAVLLGGDGSWQVGERDDVLTGPNLSDLFDVEMETVAWRESRVFVATGDDR